MKKICLLTTVILSLTALGLSANLNLNSQNTFTPGEEIKFNYSIQGDKEIRYIPSISCPSAREPLLQVLEADLSQNTVNSTYRYSTVTTDMEPQNCTASVNILDENQSVSKQLEIEGRPSFDLQLKICTDESCDQERTVFELGETPYITVDTEKSPEISSTLETPTGTEKITFPTNRGNLEKGNYKIRLNASLEGYQNQTVEKGFAVIGDSPDFQEESFEDSGETAGILSRIISFLSQII
jgi:hypothetical protein